MLFDLDLIKKVYAQLPGKIEAARKLTGKPLTLAEKIYTLITFSRHRHLTSVVRIMWILHRTVWPCRMQQPRWLCYNL
jgi:hypothetical protein